MSLSIALTALDVVFFVLGLLLIGRLVSRPRQSLPLPPGPRGWPLVGNIFDMPSEKEWLAFAQLGEKWGNISSLTVLGQTLIIVNSAKIASDMLDKKGSIYSDRPVVQMAGELCGWKDTLVFLPYGDPFRRRRRMFHSLLGSHTAVTKYHPVEENETRKFLRRLMSDPENLLRHIRRTAGAIILRISHGYEVQDDNDPFIELADRAMVQFSAASAPGAFLVDLIPALRHVPEWFPGAGFKRKAREWAAVAHEMVNRPHNYVKEQIVAGTAFTSFTSEALEDKTSDDEQESFIKWSSASLYAGGSDTTVSAIYSFFLAMTLYPEVQKKAQAEIDAVIGRDRLPTFSDKANLPYINAVVTEVLRWNSVAPTGGPHRVMQDDVHEGYFIPKGSIVFANLWKLTHDPRVYHEPDTFNPERFLPSDGRPSEPDPRNICFGYGRRICPGMYLADASIFITCTMTFAAFEISKYVDNGTVVEPVYEPSSGAISHPKPFKCSIKPRSQKYVSLILSDEGQ